MKIKSYLKIITWILILICILLLKGFESQFQHVQKLLVLESNNLLSSRSLQADEGMNTIWKELVQPGETFWILGMVEKKPKLQVLAFYATDYEKVTFPLKLGRAFSVKDSSEAIVGMEVQTYKLSDGEYFDYGNIHYRVIGKLGIAEDSPLKYTVLLNNLELLEQPNVPLTFDGPHLGEISWLKGNSSENRGVERWFNIAFIANWIRYMTWLVILCASVLSMYYYLIVTKESRYIRMEIGIDVGVIFGKGIWHITMVTLFIASVIVWIIGEQTLFIEFIMSSFVIYLVLLISYYIMFWRQMAKEKTHYV